MEAGQNVVILWLPCAARLANYVMIEQLSEANPPVSDVIVSCTELTTRWHVSKW